MTTVLNRDSIKVKRDLQKRVENWVAEYCDALEENFKQYSLRMFETSIKENRFPENTKYYQDRINEINDGTANLYKFDYQVGKKYIKVFNLQYQESNDYYGREAGYRQGSVTAFIDKNTGEVYKPASWKSPAKIVRFNLLIIAERNYLLNSENCDWAGGHLYMR